ncbi:hypothetical protein DFQ27_009297 [Actinomortierella ambigua]|uniref:Protein kinase domain-containing protein n=1 Tax=Actinomortierella ambigua TaxID=1343610 RepID=A0A9P6QEN4_9FUNG|nr:hypothetical protein DFQ27_009297 [Actinomortierella ambigua]
MGNTNTKDAGETSKRNSFVGKVSKLWDGSEGRVKRASPASSSVASASSSARRSKAVPDSKPLTGYLTDEQRSKLTDKDLQALVSNEIPAIEIEDLSIGVDSGGMGVIHMAVWKGQQVAIKEATASVVAREVDVYIRMRGCENVVPFYGVACPERLGKICIVTKFASGGSLSWHLKVSFDKMTWDEKLRLASQITAGIARLHQEGVYHRDLHGGNVLIDEQGNALLTDFGASSIIVEKRIVQNIEDFRIHATDNPDGTSKYTSKIIESHGEGKKTSYPLIGVMAYIAPELFRDPSTFNDKCDVYSLGVLFWELTSGRSAFSRHPQDVELAVSILNGNREAPVAGTIPAFKDLYERCWSPNPTLRPSVQEILQELEKIRASLTAEELAVKFKRSDFVEGDDTIFTESVSIHRPTSPINSNFLFDD